MFASSTKLKDYERVNHMSCLVALCGEKKTEIGKPEKNKKLASVLISIGIVVGILSFAAFGGFGSIWGIVAFCAAVSFVLAGVYQLLGVCECTCPYCEEKGYIKLGAEKYKCKNCKNTSLVKKL